MPVQIRAAGTADVPAIAAMGARFIGTTAYRTRVPVVDPATLEAFVQQLVDGEASAVLVTDRDGRLTAMLGLFVYPHPIIGQRVASEAFWWSEHVGDGLKLLAQAVAWATEHGATRLQMIAPDDRVGRVYAARGFDLVERLYERTL